MEREQPSRRVQFTKFTTIPLFYQYMEVAQNSVFELSKVSNHKYTKTRYILVCDNSTNPHIIPIFKSHTIQTQFITLRYYSEILALWSIVTRPNFWCLGSHIQLFDGFGHITWSQTMVMRCDYYSVQWKMQQLSDRLEHAAQSAIVPGSWA